MAAAGVFLFSACGSTSSPAGPADTVLPTADGSAGDGVVLPLGLASADALVTEFDSYSGNIVLETVTVAEPGVVQRVELHVNGDESWQSVSVSGDGVSVTSELLYFDNGERYSFAGPTGTWTKELDVPSALASSRPGPWDVLVPQGLDGARVEETATGYRIVVTDVALAVGSGAGGTFFGSEVFVDADRVLRSVDLVSEGEVFAIVEVTYPGSLDPLVVPTAFVDLAAVAGEQARAALEGVVVALLGLPDPSIATAEALSELVSVDAELPTYVLEQQSWDTTRVGFASNGSTVELVVSDGVGTCYRALVVDGEVSYRDDSDGVGDPFGFMCNTTIDR